MHSVLAQGGSAGGHKRGLMQGGRTQRAPRTHLARVHHPHHRLLVPAKIEPRQQERGPHHLMQRLRHGHACGGNHCRSNGGVFAMAPACATAPWPAGPGADRQLFLWHQHSGAAAPSSPFPLRSRLPLPAPAPLKQHRTFASAVVSALSTTGACAAFITGSAELSNSSPRARCSRSRPRSSGGCARPRPSFSRVKSLSIFSLDGGVVRFSLSIGISPTPTRLSWLSFKGRYLDREEDR